MIRGTLFLIVCLFTIPCSSAAQTTRSDDPIRELLSEVRLLRQALERAATTGTRIQLLVARVQLQEQRISDLSRRLDSVRAELRDLDRGIAPMSEQMAAFEESISTTENANERQAAEQQVAMFKAQVAAMERRRQELTSDEAFLAQQLSTEQNRWAGFNERLEQLERSLNQK
jgi:chromosome segregation ATPase